MLTIAPPPWRSITGSTCLQPRNTLFRLKSTCASHTASLISTGPPAAEPPTLLTSTSTRPKRSRHARTMLATASLLVTSQMCVVMLGALSSVSFSACASRSTANTLAPSSAKRTVVARPLPQPGPTDPAPVTMATLSLSREPIEPLRIVDEQPLALGLGGRVFADQVGEIAVVRHKGEIRMRPVGAPERAIAELGDGLAPERHGVAPGRAVARDALGAAHLDPDVLRLQEREQRLELCALRAARSIDAPHVIDDDRYGRALQCRRELGDARAGEVDLQVPADVREARRHGEHRIDRVAAAQMIHVMEARAAKALRMQPRELERAGSCAHEGHAAVALRPGRDQIGGRGIVEAVRRRLHHHAALDAEMLMQREQRLLRRIASRRIAALGREREAALRSEHMEMRVARAPRQLQFRLARLRLVRR